MDGGADVDDFDVICADEVGVGEGLEFGPDLDAEGGGMFAVADADFDGGGEVAALGGLAGEDASGISAFLEAQPSGGTCL